ncbi:Leucine-rich repeat-containing protein [Artemisia annua]|uniref:Leucine-rich repeat-containing protein n=1 Tax=Artemisia annua TaxID=35608 RepID=A0A2U1KVU5_ARTAN|nr:Leucine-rich repeat-containing protein [Artemisia annua]
MLHLSENGDLLLNLQVDARNQVGACLKESRETVQYEASDIESDDTFVKLEDQILQQEETLPRDLNFLSTTGDYSEGGMRTSSYGYIGGH